MKVQVTILFCFIIFFSSCSDSSHSKSSPQNESDTSGEVRKKNLPDHLKEIENLTVYSASTQVPDTVEMIRDQVFESNEAVLINGNIGEIAVDDNNRVYIEAFSPGFAGIYVFDANGKYLTTIGRFGRGPGEFESIGSVQVSNDILYVFDPRLQKFSLFSLDDFSHIKDRLINRDEVKNIDTLAYRLKGDELIALSNEELLLKLSGLAFYKENDISKILYYRISEDGMIKPGRIMELDRFSFFFPPKTDNRIPDLPFTMPFTRGSLISITPKGSFFTAWTEDFLIKKYDENGNYMRAFYYPIKKSSLSLDEFDISGFRQKILSDYTMPESWQALHTMELDDEGRLWVATITDDKENYKWWVLNPEGELLARFTFPGKRSKRSTFAPIFDVEIKSGFFYITEKNESNGLKSVVRYKINFKPN